MPASLKMGVWLPQEGLGRYTSRGPPWNRDCAREETRWDSQPNFSICLCLSEPWKETSPKSWLQCAEIQFLRWSGRWCSVGRWEMLHSFTNPFECSLGWIESPAYPAALQDLTISTKCELGAGLGKIPQTTNGKIFLIQLFCCNYSLRLEGRCENHQG